MSDTTYLLFEDLARPVRLSNCRDLMDCFPLIFSDWQITEQSATNQAPVITVARDDDGVYTLQAEWLDEAASYDDEVDLVCALIAKLSKARVLEDMNLLCLHGAAAEIGGALVIFANQYRAGKSVLSACLAAAGCKLYSDDVLPISLASGEGIAPGIAPRLRFPYPHNLAAETRSFIEARAALKGKRYHYLDLRGDLLAARNSRAPIGAFVFLDRAEGVVAELQPVSGAEALRQVIWQNFAREVDAPSILDRLGQVVNASRAYRLRFDRADDAARLLMDTFARQAPAADSAVQWEIETAAGQAVPSDVPAGCLMRKNGISEIKSDHESFLADASGASIHHLNVVGSAVWNLLAEPISVAEIIDLLLLAFPDAERSQVDKDVRKLIKTLAGKNLLRGGPG